MKLWDRIFGGKKLFIIINIVMLLYTVGQLLTGTYIPWFLLLYFSEMTLSAAAFVIIINILGYIFGSNRDRGVGMILTLAGGVIGTFIAIKKSDKYIDKRYRRFVYGYLNIFIWVYAVLPAAAMITGTADMSWLA